MSNNGKLIVICGVDGSGKTSLQNYLKEYLTSQGKRVFTTRQPSDFYRNHPQVRQFLDTGKSSSSKETIALIAATDRMLHIENTILPRLRDGEIVICDRYVYSTYAYFKARNVDEKFVRELNKYVPEPDLGIFLKVDSKVAIQRILDRDGSSRKFEEKNPDYLDLVQDYLGECIGTMFVTLDSNLPHDEVKKLAINHLNTLL